MKEIGVCVLMDLYGKLLTAKQRDALSMYYELDYSLSEIAENLSVTRQAAMDAIKRGEAKLREYEDALGMRDKFERTEKVADELASLGGPSAQCASRLMEIWGDTDGI